VLLLYLLALQALHYWGLGVAPPVARLSNTQAGIWLLCAGLVYYASAWVAYRASWAQHWLGMHQTYGHPAQIPIRALLWWTNLSGVLWLWNLMCVLRGRPPLYERWSRCILCRCT